MAYTNLGDLNKNGHTWYIKVKNFRPVDNELKIIFIYNTKVQEVMEASKIFQKFFFDFAIIDMLLERESKDKQSSGKVKISKAQICYFSFAEI
jgi:hypothetical protein